jgi:hypothetical protein
MKEIPLKSDAELRGDDYVRKEIEPTLTSILFRSGQMVADKINKLHATETTGKSCKCMSCSRERERLAKKEIKSLNWYLDMLEPEKRGKSWLEVFRCGRGWDIKKVIKNELP